MINTEGKLLDVDCPVCGGTGKVKPPKPKKEMEEMVKVAKALKKAGFSFREIMELMGYKSTRSVSYLLGKK